VTKTQARFGGTAREIGAEIWDRLARGRARTLPYPFTRHAFLCALEESGSATAKTGSPVLNRAAVRLNQLRGTLRTWFNFYDLYDPKFAWWVDAEYKKADENHLLETTGRKLRKLMSWVDEEA